MSYDYNIETQIYSGVHRILACLEAVDQEYGGRAELEDATDIHYGVSDGKGWLWAHVDDLYCVLLFTFDNDMVASMETIGADRWFNEVRYTL